MEYLIPAVLVLLVVLGFVTFLVLNVTKQGDRVDEQVDQGVGEQADRGVDEPDDDDDEPATPASERLANRGFGRSPRERRGGGLRAMFRSD